VEQSGVADGIVPDADAEAEEQEDIMNLILTGCCCLLGVNIL
jgi:hypothetical protein